MNSEIQIMTPYELAVVTNSSLRLIYKELKNGTIPHVKLGDKYLISREKFKRWLNGSEEK